MMDLMRRHAGGHHVGCLLMRSPCAIAVGPEHDFHAGRIDLGEVAGLNPVRGLLSRPVGICPLPSWRSRRPGGLPSTS